VARPPTPSPTGPSARAGTSRLTWADDPRITVAWGACGTTGATCTPRPERTVITRRRLAAALTATALALVACGPDDTTADDSDVAVPDESGDDGEPDADPADEDAEDPEDAGEAGEAEGEPGDGDVADAAPLGGDPSTEERMEDGEAPLVSVTDVRVASHTGFDRVVFEIGGDGRVGWGVLYQDQALTQGRGDEVELEGDAVLEVALRNIAMPFDAPDDVEAHDGPERIPGPQGGAILEIVEDTIFEGQHVFFVGVDEERPFRIARLDDPQRVVIDVVTDS
jgi:hypothetical protein